MRKTGVILLILSIFVVCNVFAQSAPGKYFVQFTDKNYNSHHISNPRKFLSERALERRIKQNIPIDSLDLPVSDFYLQEIEKAGGRILHKSKWFNAATVEANVESMEKIMAFPFVKKEYQAPKYFLSEIEKTYNSNLDIDLCEILGNETEAYGKAYYQLKMLNGDALHCMGYTGNGMLIGVLDAGFQKVDSLQVFNNLWKNGQIAGTKDFVNAEHNVFKSHPHGMYVLSIMGANLPGSMIGTAPDADYLLIRTEDGPTEFMIEEDNWVAGAEFADSAGVDIINSSLGYTTYDDASQSHTYKDMDGNTTRVTIGANIAASKGILVVNSAGNSGASDWQYIGAPADGRGVLAIGAVNYLSEYSFFSSKGPSYDRRIKPDVTALGQGTAIASLTDGQVVNGNGTSFSAPVISGLVACLWQAFPSMNRLEIMSAITQSSDRFARPDSLYGYGIPDFAKAFKLLKQADEEPFTDGNQVSVFPNPFSSQIELSFKFSDNRKVMVEIFNYNGVKIFQKEYSSEANVTNRKFLHEAGFMTSGFYFLRISAGDYIVTKKLVKN
jgi:serine protease AprX